MPPPAVRTVYLSFLLRCQGGMGGAVGFGFRFFQREGTEGKVIALCLSIVQGGPWGDDNFPWGQVGVLGDLDCVSWHLNARSTIAEDKRFYM
jgi:hypothetical protein